jgi:3-hydroxyacyl-[acyl-carrier-protein] dehydratase
MPDEPPIDLTALDFSRPVAGKDEIRSIIPHRFEMEMLTGIVLLDPEKDFVVGFKDLTSDDFWVRGHMPGYPLFPGVLMCEAAAQLCAFYAITQKATAEGILMGLGAIENARFLRPARPGDRLVLVGSAVKLHRRMTKFQVTGYVGTAKTFEALVVGVPLGKWEEMRGA